MSGIRSEIRKLEAAHARGALTSAQLEAAKSALVHDVVDAVTDTPGARPRSASRPVSRSAPRAQPARADAPKTDMVFNVVIAIGLAAMACLVLGTWILRDFTLALTLTVTLLAAVAIRVFRKLDDE